ncbi:anthranilate phosphoribosyltransferase [Desertibacillus haloalkaliphilus]|uniref:anthranilate phosphoribosyltransferase n=1 Tax=Desertibacillus haloalkaliphilus TaxID=1328930 RepID=UPI001C276347|nr:anthranilate phosphoribosyltransferase [Desertibacillus haloalkaliphilus]MBU8907250.1 anthranilate phosphoribosyltransferase [Desertibacillus haloalkaliphilus]
MVKEILKKCMEGTRLTEQEAKRVMDDIMEGKATESQIASLLTVLRFRGETVDEMTGFAKSMKEHAITIPHQEDVVVDTCGTGGDEAKTFNISTTTAIVLSACGVKVAKHGNRAVSSKSGSADALEKLNVSIQSTPESAAEALRDKGMCFMFAPLYHVAMKHAVTPRKEIGFRTIFNLLGPLTNPAQSKNQLIGVYDTRQAEKMAETLARLGSKRALLVTGGEGIDECSISSHTDIVELNEGKIRRYVITPEDVGLQRGNFKDIQVNTVTESATLVKQVLEGEANLSATNIVLLNAGAGLYVAGQVESIAEGVAEVKKVFKTNQVRDHFLKLQIERQESQHA